MSLRKLCDGLASFSFRFSCDSDLRSAGAFDHRHYLDGVAQQHIFVATKNHGLVSASVERIQLNFANPDPALGDKRSEPDQPHPFLTDLNVRKALQMVINTTEMAKQLYGPAGDGTCLVLNAPPNLVSKNITCSKADDAAVAAANKLLDDAGWTKGSDGIRHKTVNGKDVKMNIVYQTTVNALRQKEQAFVKDAWSKIGVSVELKSVQAGVFFSSDEANPDTAAKFWTDIEMFTNGPDSTDPTNYLRGWTCAEIKTKAAKWSGNNYERGGQDFAYPFERMHTHSFPIEQAELCCGADDDGFVTIQFVPRSYCWTCTATDSWGASYVNG